MISCHKNNNVPHQTDVKLRIGVEKVSDVGAELEIYIQNKLKYNGPAKLLVNNALVNHSLELSLQGKNKKLLIPDSLMEYSGVYNFYLVVGDHVVSQTQTIVEPDRIVDPIEVFTGPNTIWVDDLQESMVVALPKDQYDNPAKDNEKTVFNRRMPSGRTVETEVAVVNHLAPYIFSSQDQKGDVYIGISAQEASAKEQKLKVIPLWPTEVVLNIESVLPYADSREFIRVKTKVMKDDNGDIVPDGTHVLMRSYVNKKTAKYNAYSIDGIASCYIRNPERSGRMTIDAIVGDRIISNKIYQEFKSNIKEVPYAWKNDTLAVGPITSYLGQYVPDGTKVTLSFKGKEILKETEEGKIVFNVGNDFSVGKLILSELSIDLEKE